MFEKIYKWFDNEENIQLLKDNMVYIILGMVVLIFIIWFCWYLTSKRRRAHLRFHWNHMLYAIGIRKIIPRRWVSRAHVRECYDPLVDFLPHEHIFFNNETIEQPNLIRKRVLFKLYRIADRLPEGVNIMIFNTFKSKAKANEKWKAAVAETMAENPGIGLNEIMKLTKYKTADPKSSTGGHDTGGAVDVALCNDKGEIFDYGTSFHEYNDRTSTVNSRITAEQLKNRKQLVKIMRRYNFVNFPAEWWHFSYGDRMWAAYKGKRNGGIYGSAEIEIDGNYGFTIPVHRAVHEVHK